MCVPFLDDSETTPIPLSNRNFFTWCEHFACCMIFFKLRTHCFYHCYYVINLLCNCWFIINLICILDNNECLLGTFVCHSTQTCSNTAGGYECVCATGQTFKDGMCQGKIGMWLFFSKFTMVHGSFIWTDNLYAHDWLVYF